MSEPVHIRVVLDGILRDRRPIQGPRRLCIGCEREPAAALDEDFCYECIDSSRRMEDDRDD